MAGTVIYLDVLSSVILSIIDDADMELKLETENMTSAAGCCVHIWQVVRQV